MRGCLSWAKLSRYSSWRLLHDATMLAEADEGILFRAPDNVIEEFSQFPSVTSYEELKLEFIKASERELSI